MKHPHRRQEYFKRARKLSSCPRDRPDIGPLEPGPSGPLRPRSDTTSPYLTNVTRTLSSRPNPVSRHTYVPLSIAYLSAEGRILEIKEGRPLDQTILTPTQPYRNVLEVNRGWFERHGLGVGDRVTLPSGLPQAQ